MKHRLLPKAIAVFLALCLIFCTAIPAFAEEAADTTAYEAFVANLEVLEEYSHAYVQTHTNENETLNVINYIRTGVSKYTTDSWTILAGAENTGFKQYVAEQDAINGTTASDLKHIQNEYTIANGDTIDLRHMFGSMDVAYYSTAQGASAALVRCRADLSSWAGDVCDLMLTSGKDNEVLSDDLEEMTQKIYTKYLGQNYDYAFGQDDIYGDLDAFYLLRELENSDKRISQLMSEYFIESLTDEQRVDYFLKHRFGGVLSQNDIRLSVYRAYVNNNLMYSLETSRNLNKKHTLRTACCYAFADYLFLLAGDPDAEDTIGEEEEPEEDNDYYSVFSSTSSNLAPGIKQDIKYAVTKDNKQIVYYLATVDINRDDVNIYANYNNNDPTSWAMARTTDQMAAIQAKHSNPDDPDNYIENYNTIIGTNGDFYNMGNGKPSGALVMNGVQYAEHNYRVDRGFFAILKDGTPVIGSGEDWDAIADNVQEAIGGSWVIIKNGELVNQTTVTDYYGTRAPRTCIGITAEGKLIMMVLDGRQEPFSAGGNIAEIAQIMLDAGCVEAINLDGGGSSTFAAKQEGSDEVTVVNRPSDGYERSVSSSLVVVSTAEPSNKFDHVLVESDTDYLTVNSSLALNMNGVSTTGNSADVPEDAAYQLSDDTIGHIEDGVFYADKLGAVEVSVVSDGEVIGSKTLTVVKPDRLFFTKASQDVIYGRSITLPVNASYNGNAVTINARDIIFQLSNNAAGTFSDFEFTAAENSGLNNITITALLSTDFSVKAQMSVSLYEEGAAVFDFDNAMCGDRMLAWNREVSNSTTVDNKVYYIEKEDGGDMTAVYTFGIDMRSVPIPSQLTDLLYMVAGGDIEGMSAWMFLLQLAERVSPLTHVSVTLKLHQDVDVDLSELKIVSDYFTLDNTEYDPVENTIKLDAHWIKQSAAIPEDTANPICIVSGIKITPRDNAYWENDTDLIVPLTGKLHYWIGLRSSTLHRMASDPEFQQAYGIYDYDNSMNLKNDAGGCFEMDYLDFDDTYQLNREIKQGWKEFYGKLYYFVDNQPLTGIQKLPSREDGAKEYYYDLGENGVCAGRVNGLFEYEGDTYYAVNGTTMTEWRLIADANGTEHYYYFDPATGKALDGEQIINKYRYVFENHQLKYGQWVQDANGTKYMWAGKFVHNAWFSVDGIYYFARPSYYTARGAHFNDSLDGSEKGIYYFSEATGEWLEDYTGFYIYNGAKYYMENGKTLKHAGLIEVDGDYYYVNSSDKVVCGCDYYVSNPNGLIAKGTYHFDADGKLQLNSEPDEPDDPPVSDKKNGLYNEDGQLYYYVNDVKTHAGLIKIGDDYYYIKSNCTAVRNCDYFVSDTNGIMPRATHHFDADGKMTDVPDSVAEPDEPDDPPVSDKKNGLYNEGGQLYYYVDDVKTHAGLIKIGDDYYYIKSNCTAVRNCDYFISDTNGIMPRATHHFDADGKMTDVPDSVEEPDEPDDPPVSDKKNGLYNEGGQLYYYVDDVKTHAGLIKIGDDYYYIKSNCTAVRNCDYFVSDTNGIMPRATHHFDADGKMTDVPDSVAEPDEPDDPPVSDKKNGLYNEGGQLYYYVDDVKTHAGLIKIGDDYYYIKSNCTAVRDCDYFISNTNDLMPRGTYHFDADGKMEQ